MSGSSFVKVSSKHLYSKFVRAREMKLWENFHVPLYVTCHLSHVGCHMSCVTCHNYISDFFFFFIYMYFVSSEKVVKLVGWGSTCYQLAAPCLILLDNKLANTFKYMWTKMFFSRNYINKMKTKIPVCGSFMHICNLPFSLLKPQYRSVECTWNVPM